MEYLKEYSDLMSAGALRSTDAHIMPVLFDVGSRISSQSYGSCDIPC